MQTYQSDLSDSQWKVVEKVLDCQRKRKYELRQIVNAILYLLDNGVKWRNLPEEYPRWEIVYYGPKQRLSLGPFPQVEPPG
jgi:transposase